MVGDSSVLPILQKLVGREVTYVDEFEVEKGMLKRFAIAIGDLNPLYYDEEFSKATIYGGIIAPPTFIFEWNHHKHRAVSLEDRSSIFITLDRQPPSALASNEFEFIQPVRPGDIIKSKSRITEVYEKQGRSGQLVFVVGETNYFNQKEQLLGKARDTLVFIPRRSR